LGSREEVVINASWGLGESIVAGFVTPDMYVVAKRGEVTERIVGTKESMTVLDDAGTRDAPVSMERRGRLCLTDAQVHEVARMAVALEERMGWPVDIECGFAGSKLWLLQCRPITALK
jgi:rifampicin phosphotransferase